MAAVFEGRLCRKKAEHGRFEDPYKERVYCWISASGVFHVCPTVAGSVARPSKEEQAAAERLDLKDFAPRVDDKVKFSLSAHGSRSVKFKADKPTELELWVKHLKEGAAAAQRRGAAGVVAQAQASQKDIASRYLPSGKEEALLAKEQEVSRMEKDVQARLGQVDCGVGKEMLLLQAAERGQIEQIKVLLASGMSPDAAPEVGYTALMSASETGQIEAIRILVKAKASVSARMEGGTSAIHLAAMTGHVDVVNLLSELGADANDSNDGGTTPLMLAAMEGHVPVCLRLHDLGADVNAIESSVIPELEKQIAELQDDVTEAKRDGVSVEGLQLEESALEEPDVQIISDLQLEDEPSSSAQNGEAQGPGGGAVALAGPNLWDIFGSAYNAKHSQVNANQGAFDMGSVNLAAASAITTFSAGLQDKLKHVGGGLLGTMTGNQNLVQDATKAHSLGAQLGSQVGSAVRSSELGRAVRDGIDRARDATSQLGFGCRV